MAKQRINLSLKPAVVAALSDLAEANSITVSGLVERFVSLYVPHNHANLNPDQTPNRRRRPHVKRVADLDCA